MNSSPKNIQRESHYRSILKGISWRILGTIDTVVLSFLITKNGDISLKIAFTEVITKIVLYWLHERLWQLFCYGPQKRIISLAKSLSWRILGSLDTMILSWYYTGDLSKGMQIASLEILSKMILYYIHERAWTEIPTGTIRKFFK